MRISTDEIVPLHGTLPDVKLIYCVLYSQIKRHVELFECELFATIQRTLQERAIADGVNLADHSAWEEWLRPDDPALFEEKSGRVSKVAPADRSTAPTQPAPGNEPRRRSIK